MTELLIPARTTLEDWSLWYKYKTQVWSQDSEQATTIHNTMRMLRSIHNTDFVYLSAPVSSGFHHAKLLHQYRQEHGEPTGEDLERLQDHAFCHNYRLASEFLERLTNRDDMREPLIFAPDFAPIRLEYEQTHFMALWLSVIAEKCWLMYSHYAWSASNGAAEEFTHVMQLKLGIPKHNWLSFQNPKESIEHARKRMRNIQVIDSSYQKVDLARGYRHIQRAVDELKELNYPTAKLEFCLEALDWTHEQLAKGFYQ